ncbi:MAG: Glycosyl transferase family 2 [Microgenomates group bacterium GW2011_GWF2_47_9]|nr:MAG: Glycosyl transferase family 2 [Microgenomates group bacterium GW2011_GWF2_47_9]
MIIKFKLHHSPITAWLIRHAFVLTGIALSLISLYFFVHYLDNGLALRYNDARSHLDIGRRVVEGLKPGLAQLGSVWLPLNHMLMVPLIWHDWAWHSGFAGAFWNMLSFVGTGLVIYRFLENLKVGILGRLVAVAIFVFNVNILYLQSTAMTEIILLFTMTTASYYLLKWHISGLVLDLVKSAFWVMLATLVRYDGWFLLGIATLLVMKNVLRHGLKKVEGVTLLFLTLAGVGVVAWFAWNQLIFKDALYFILGPFSAHSQQLIMEQAGALPTKHNLLLSTKVYLYALLYNSYTYPALISAIGLFVLLRDKVLAPTVRTSTTILLSPLLFNILSLYLGFSVIYVQGISGDTWFNIRYGVMLAPSIAIFVGYLIDRARRFRLLLIGSLIFVLFFAFTNQDAVSIDDAMVGSSQKNVSEVSDYLQEHAKDKPGYILISAASHDAIIFSSGLPMSRFIHEGTGKYWQSALAFPDRWARWIVMRTYSVEDLVWADVSTTKGFAMYHKVRSFPFADIYELDESLLKNLNTTPTILNNK